MSSLIQTSTTLTTSSVVEEARVMFMDVQTELIFFALAVATHLLFFSKLTLRRRKNKVVENLFPGALISAPRVQQGTTPISNSLVAFKAAVRANDIASAMSQFEALQSLWQEQDSPSSAPQMLLDQLVKLAGQSGALPALLQLVTKLGLLAKALDLVLNECAQHKDASTLKEAERLAREHDVKLLAVTYQVLLKASCSCGKFAHAKSIMKEAQDAGMGDVATHGAYIKELLKGGNNQEAHKALEGLKASGLQLTSTQFNCLLSAAVASNAGTAWSMFEQMKQFDVNPDQVTCSILFKSISKSSNKGDLERLMKTLDSLSCNADEVLTGAAVETCLRVGRSDLLVAFLRKQRASGRLLIKGAHTYGSIIRAYGYVHDMQGAWETWNEMRRQDIVPISVTLGCMVEAVVTNGDIEAGYELIQQMRQDAKTAPLVNAVIYGSIVKGFSHKKCFERVWEVYDEMIAQDLQFSMVTFNTFIDACSRSGDLERIPALLKDVDAQGLKLGVVSYSTITKGYCQANLLDEAFELIEGMQKATELEPDEIIYNTLLDGCARRGLYDRGMQTYKMMQASGLRPSNYTLSVIVKMANRAKKLEQAFNLCEEISSSYGFRLNVHVFNNLVQACINHNDLPRATGVLERMLRERVRPDVRTYSLLLRACVDMRKGMDAVGILRAGTGLAGLHPQLAKYAATAEPQGGLPGDLVSEVLSGIIDRCCEESLASSLLVDLARSLPNLRLDPKLRLWLAARVGLEQKRSETKVSPPWRR